MKGQIGDLIFIDFQMIFCLHDFAHRLAYGKDIPEVFFYLV